MNWIADMSFAHDDVTGAILAAHDVPGVIGYVSDNPRKNLTKANLADQLGHGRLVGLVFEDSTDDMRGGAISGDHHGATALAQGLMIGYDVRNCVIFAADDENTSPADWPTVLAYLDAFAGHVPVPGYYGDQDSIDWLAPQRPHWFYWQADALSWGAGISRNAHLVQRYNDPRVAGLPLDASDIQRPGVPFMGDDMFTDADRATLNGIASQILSPSGFLARFGVNLSKVAGQIEQAEHLDVAAQLTALRAALTVTPGTDGSGDDPHALADAVAAEFAQRLGINPPA